MILQSLRLKPMHGNALVKHSKQISDDLLQMKVGSL
jgi:DNA-binding PadR family transcriptional regulator